MKYKVEMPKDWKTTFTVAQLEEIKRIKTSKDEDLPATLEMFASILAGNDTILNVSFEWCTNSENAFYNNNVDIWVDMWCTDRFFEVHHFGGMISDLNEIGSISREDAVYINKTFKLKE